MIKVLSVGKNKEQEFESIAQDYLQRIRRFHKIELIEIKEAKNKNDVSKVLQEEANHLFKHIKTTDFVVTLSLEGKMLDSVELSNNLKEWLQKGPVVFIIGGSWGLHEDIQNRAQVAWKLSDLTFPHLLARLMVLEQIYRGFKIGANHTYHK